MAAADQSSKKPSGADESLRLFLSRTQAWEDPSAGYTFDGERGTARTVICREHSNQPKTRQHTGDISTGEQGRGRQKDCIDLDMYSTQLFAAMQNYGFYCALPSDPSRTHMVCRKLPKM
ncbi:hypothetical protein F5J12DRAFT_482309 [Pisolithus orientalis]|uniref:uncharacterized protein n=1 Tax=Pisolithus orientalis TaxID=936130 RepID=UPI002225B4B8|nr:uncharacterized protein F5J12DRAFT_482309 [Pisolithus orientalis]KAI6019669.1 hypothetical protein F5J12DRAFT_482309 [Pisolithus orientalis]